MVLYEDEKAGFMLPTGKKKGQLCRLFLYTVWLLILSTLGYRKLFISPMLEF
jgi:hypothetical protein